MTTSRFPFWHARIPITPLDYGLAVMLLVLSAVPGLSLADVMATIPDLGAVVLAP